MTDLAKMLFATLENHGKQSVAGLYKQYPYWVKESVRLALYELKDNGLVKITMKIIWVKFKPVKTEKNISRTSKQYYTQPSLF